jgi:hypothetical protein
MNLFYSACPIQMFKNLELKVGEIKVHNTLLRLLEMTFQF